MNICPKCGESNLVWVLTKTKKHWLKKDLGEGQTGKEWHECKDTSTPHIIRPFCNTCMGKLILCDNPSCKLCYYNKSYCAKCDVHPNIVNMK